MNIFDNSPRVGVIILNWNSWKDTVSAAESIALSDYKNIIIYIVDNASSDQSESYISSKLNFHYEFIQSGANLGWSGGNNLGIKLAIEQECNLIYLINPDVRVSTNSISELVKAATSLTDAAAIGSIVLSYDNPMWIEFAGTVFDKNTNQLIHLSGKKNSIAVPSELYKTLSIKGCSLMIKKEAIATVGLLATDYFLNYDETDWCFRASKLNFNLYMAPDSEVLHIGAQTFGGTESPIYRYFITRNRLLFSKRHLGRKDLIFAWRCALWEYKNIFTINKFKNNFLQKIYISIAVSFAIFDYVFHRYGDCPLPIRKITNQFNLIKNKKNKI